MARTNWLRRVLRLRRGSDLIARAEPERKGFGKWLVLVLERHRVLLCQHRLCSQYSCNAHPVYGAGEMHRCVHRGSVLWQLFALLRADQRVFAE